MNDLFLSIGAPPINQALNSEGVNKPSQSGENNSFQKTLKSYQEKKIDDSKDEEKSLKPQEDKDSKPEICVPLIQVAVVELPDPDGEISQDQPDLLAQSSAVEAPITDTTQSSSKIQQPEEAFNLSLSDMSLEESTEQIPVPIQAPVGSKNGNQTEDLTSGSKFSDSIQSIPAQTDLKIETDVEPELDQHAKAKIFNPSPQVTIGAGTINNPNTEINLSQLARPAETKQMEILSQVSNVLDHMVEKGNSTIKLQLFPQDLGKIELTVVNRKNGVEINLIADTPATQRIIESDLDNLRQHLTANGIEIANLNIGQSNQQSWTGESQSWTQSKFKNSKFYSPNLKLETMDISPNLILNASGVDYKV